MPGPFRRLVPTALAAGACLVLALPARATDPSAAGASPAGAEAVREAAALAHQRDLVVRMRRAAIWQEARARFREAHERAEQVERARRGSRAARRGLHARRAGDDEADLPSEPRAGGAPRAMPIASPSVVTTSGVPANARCNDPSGDAASAGQSETAAAGIGALLVVGWNDGQGFNVPNGDVQGFAWSADGGHTWTDGGSPPHPPGYPAWRWIGDPVLAANERTGDFYFAGLAYSDASHNAVAVARGRFTGSVFAFDSAFVVRIAANTSAFLDKEWLACDSLTGNVYVTNTTFTATDDHVDFYRSTTGARTWSNPVTLSSGADAGWLQGSRVATGPRGEVHVTWYAAPPTTSLSALRYRRSTDAGASFATEVTPVTFHEQFGTGSPGFNREHGLAFPSIAVDRSTGPHRGAVYLAWAECFDFPSTVLPPAGATTALEAEPDGTPATATPFTVGQTLQGTLDTAAGARDLDYWSFPLAAGQSVVVEMASITPSRGWTLRLFAPDSTQQLCYGGDPDSTQTTGDAYYAFTAPASGTYFLRVASNSWQSSTYAITTAFGAHGGERGRDQRDGFVTASADGATWSPPVRIDDDGPGYDLFLPELAAGTDGAVYATWFDHRDDVYGSRTSMAASRSIDGGATWAANRTLSSAQGNFTTCATNIRPNLGDYGALSCSGSLVVPAWGDARGSSVDVWSAPVDVSSDLAGCATDTAASAPATVTLQWTIQNNDPMFDGTYHVAMTSARAWPLPAPASVWVDAASTASWSAGIVVPDTAASGVNTVCVTLTSPAGALVRQCCTRVTVQGWQLAVNPGGVDFALAEARPNPAPGRASIVFGLPRAGRARLVIHDVAGARVRVLSDGDRPAGISVLPWDGRDDGGRPVRAGAYFYRLEFGGRVLTQRLVLVR